jgi:hypothetical protein
LSVNSKCTQKHKKLLQKKILPKKNKHIPSSNLRPRDTMVLNFLGAKHEMFFILKLSGDDQDNDIIVCLDPDTVKSNALTNHP